MSWILYSSTGTWTLQSLEGLNDDDHVMAIGTRDWYLVGDLRRSLVAATDETEPLRHVRSLQPDSSYAAPDPYAPGLAALRAATKVPTEKQFENLWKAQRLAALERGRA